MPKDQPVPHFSPTAEEWSDDFAAFVRKILPQIEAYGGCTITPPASWAWSPLPLDLAQAVKPIRQHMFRAGSGLSGCYTGIFEEAPPMPLSDYMAQTERSQPPSADPEAVQSQYWRRVVTGEQCIMYGSDTDAASLFDPALAEWNLSRLPAGTDGDLLRHLPLSIPGLNKPMLYFGGWRSTFCLHTEDSELSGLSFLHKGAPKFWYIVPPQHAGRVRTLAADLYPTEHRQCAQFLRHKATLIAPATLRAHGIPVRTARQVADYHPFCTPAAARWLMPREVRWLIITHSARQAAGTFVLVLSSAFHFGFNQVRA